MKLLEKIDFFVILNFFKINEETGISETIISQSKIFHKVFR